MVARESPPSQETHVQSSPTRCWAWTIRPLLIWSRILGVELAEISTFSSKTFRWLTFAYRVFCFLVQITCLVVIFYFLHTLRLQASLDPPEELVIFRTKTYYLADCHATNRSAGKFRSNETRFRSKQFQSNSQNIFVRNRLHHVGGESLNDYRCLELYIWSRITN